MEELDTEDFYRKIGKKVAMFRSKKGLSQLELSLQMNYKSISIVSSAEVYYKGKHFNLEHLLKISKILEVDICDFFKD